MKECNVSKTCLWHVMPGGLKIDEVEMSPESIVVDPLTRLFNSG